MCTGCETTALTWSFLIQSCRDQDAKRSDDAAESDVLGSAGLTRQTTSQVISLFPVASGVSAGLRVSRLSVR